MTSATTWWPLEHERSLTGRIRLTQGPHATLVTEDDLDDMLRRVQRPTSNGTVRRSGVTLDESQLLDLLNTYFPQQDEDEHPAADCDCSDCEDRSHAEEQRRVAQTLHGMCGPDKAVL